MNEQPKHEWRIEADRFGWNSKIFLNDESWGQHIYKLELMLKADGETQMTLTLAPQRVQMVVDPELHLIVGTRRFRVLRDYEAPRCSCGHGPDVHNGKGACFERLTDVKGRSHLCACAFYGPGYHGPAAEEELTDRFGLEPDFGVMDVTAEETKDDGLPSTTRPRSSPPARPRTPGAR
jgi:hypothetical protein